MKKIVVLSGAGISAESGLATFRGEDGLWEGYDVTKVASIEAWYNDPNLVLEFYNQRRRGVESVMPNYAHKRIAELEDWFDVTVVTQNIDDLHERGGSSNIMHLHGEIRKVRCMECGFLEDRGYDDLNIGDLCKNGHQLRPDIVWFGEPVPAMEKAAIEVMQADVLLVVGTSLAVYPAASLVHYFSNLPVYLIDPVLPSFGFKSDELKYYKASAVEGIDLWIEDIKKVP